MSTGSIAAKGRRAGKSRSVERLGRVGLVAKAVLYAVIGLLAIQVARGGREESPDKGGALRTIAEQPFGKGLLVLLAPASPPTRSGGSPRASSTATARAKGRRVSPSEPARWLARPGTACSAG